MSTTNHIIETINNAARNEYLLINYIDNHVHYYAFGTKNGIRSGHNYYDGAIFLGNCKVYVDATRLNDTNNVRISNPNYGDEKKEIQYSNMVKVVKVDNFPTAAQIYAPGTRNKITMRFNVNGTATDISDTKGGKKYKKSKKQRKSKKSNKSKSKSKKNKNQRK
jgi:hypothetical protein